jgi:hypothetical protein
MEQILKMYKENETNSQTEMEIFLFNLSIISS